METIFMNTEISNAIEPHRFRLTLADKLNLKDPNKNIALANLSMHCTWKNIKSTIINITTINVKSLLQIGMIILFSLMDQILFQVFKIVLSTLLKNMKL